MRTRRLFVALVIVAILGAGACWPLSYDPKSFRGAGPIVDTGLFSYFRYHAPLGEFPLHQAGEHEFTFSGLPDERMVLMFFVPGFSSGTRNEIEKLDTQIAVEITDSTGRTVCDVRGTPSGKEPYRWTLMSSRNRAGFWHSGCNGQPFEHDAEYSLRVAVSEPDPLSPHLSLRAVLEGGGIELP